MLLDIVVEVLQGLHCLQFLCFGFESEFTVNENHNIVYVSVDGSPEECFDAWGSRVNPQFDDEYDLKNIFQLICDDGLTAIWGDWDDVLYEVDGRRAVEIVDGMRDTAAKLENLGLDEDDLQKIVNDEEWQ